MKRYLFATQGLKIICIEYTDSVAVQLVDYLHDRGWKVSKAEALYYIGQIDRYGGKIQVRSFDANTPIRL